MWITMDRYKYIDRWMIDRQKGEREKKQPKYK